MSHFAFTQEIKKLFHFWKVDTIIDCPLKVVVVSENEIDPQIDNRQSQISDNKCSCHLIKQLM